MKRDKAALQTEGGMRGALGARRSEREGKAWSSSRGKQRHNVVTWCQPRKHAAHGHTSCFSSPPERAAVWSSHWWGCLMRKGLTKRWDCSCPRDLRNNTETLLQSPISILHEGNIQKHAEPGIQGTWHLCPALGWACPSQAAPAELSKEVKHDCVLALSLTLLTSSNPTQSL